MRKTAEDVGGQHQRVDRPRLLRDTKGGRRQEEVETSGFKVIGGAPTTLQVTGLMIMMMMKVSEQCGIAASKGNHILGLIRRNITYNEKKLIVPLYKAIVRPYLEYCI